MKNREQDVQRASPSGAPTQPGPFHRTPPHEGIHIENPQNTIEAALPWSTLTQRLLRDRTHVGSCVSASPVRKMCYTEYAHTKARSRLRERFQWGRATALAVTTSAVFIYPNSPNEPAVLEPVDVPRIPFRISLALPTELEEEMPAVNLDAVSPHWQTATRRLGLAERCHHFGALMPQ